MKYTEMLFKELALNKRGSVLIFAVFMSMMVGLIGAAAVRMGTVELDVSKNEKWYQTAFFAADSGIETGRAALNDIKVDDPGNWDMLLQGQQIAGQPAGTTTLDQVIQNSGTPGVNLFSYSLQVTDNDDLDGSDQVDTDNRVYLTSTGNFQDASTSIQILVKYIGGGDQYAQEHYDTENTGVAARETKTIEGTIRRTSK